MRRYAPEPGACVEGRWQPALPRRDDDVGASLEFRQVKAMITPRQLIEFEAGPPLRLATCCAAFPRELRRAAAPRMIFKVHSPGDPKRVMGDCQLDRATSATGLDDNHRRQRRLAFCAPRAIQSQSGLALSGGFSAHRSQKPLLGVGGGNHILAARVVESGFDPEMYRQFGNSCGNGDGREDQSARLFVGVASHDDGRNCISLVT